MIKLFFVAILVTSALSTGALAAVPTTAMPQVSKPVVLAAPGVAMKKMPMAKKCNKGFNFMKRKCAVMKKK